MRPSIIRIIDIFLAAAFIAAAMPAQAQVEQASAARPAEYMIYQYPAVSLVVVVDVRESEFDTRILGPEGVLLGEAGIASRRIGPVYQFIEAVSTPRQLMIEVNPSQPIERSRINMELLQLPDSDRNARSLARAYRFLAHGMKRVHTDTTATWAERTYSLRNAAQAFGALGMEEMRLWSEYYATHLVLYEIGDVLLAMERAATVRQETRRAGFERIELATLLLEADALMMAGDRAKGDQALARYESAHGAWEGAAALAGGQGLEAERGRALFNDGLAYERQGRLERAIERYEQALDVTSDASDPDLLNRIRATTATAYEARGSTSGAISLLDDIAGDLSGGEEQAAALELARNLYEKGRLLNDTFRFREAEPELQRALDLQKLHLEDGQWGLVGLELGWARYSLGLLEAAEAVIRESLPRTPRGRREAKARAHGVMAQVAGQRGDFELASEHRAVQGELLGSDAERAAFLFDSAIDALRRDGPGSADVVRLLDQSRRQAAGSDWITGHRAGLYSCLVQIQGRGSSACGAEQARADHQALRQSGVPAVEVDAGLAWAEVLVLHGRSSEARSWMEELIDSIHFYRERLPGVIAAWFEIHREALYRRYLELAVAAGSGEGGGRILLLALERVRQLERLTADDAAAEDGTRSLLARVEAAQPAPGGELSRQAQGQIEAFRTATGWTSGAMTRGALDKMLAEIPRGETLLAFHFGASQLYAVTADRKDIRRTRLAPANRVRTQLDSLRNAVQSPGGTAPLGGLDSLGGLLLKPLERHLGKRIYLLSSGPLMGFPLDALRMDGRYLAESRRFVNLDSLHALAGPVPGLSGDYRDRVFVAGNPRSGRDLFSYGVTTSKEISAVRDEFVGGGLHIVQGVALRGDEFQDERYGAAAVVHLAMPGRVDLAYPERSRLLLSGDRESPTAEFLSPLQLRGTGLTADLAVLSGTAFADRARTDFDSRIPLVHDLQAAGARQVLASLWPAGDGETAGFMAEFYRRLEKEKNISEALFQTRQSQIASKSDTNIRLWAGFQLFIR